MLEGGGGVQTTFSCSPRFLLLPTGRTVVRLEPSEEDGFREHEHRVRCARCVGSGLEHLRVRGCACRRRARPNSLVPLQRLHLLICPPSQSSSSRTATYGRIGRSAWRQWPSASPRASPRDGPSAASQRRTDTQPIKPLLVPLPSLLFFLLPHCRRTAEYRCIREPATFCRGRRRR